MMTDLRDTVGMLLVRLIDPDHHQVMPYQRFGARPAVGDVIDWLDRQYRITDAPALWHREIASIGDVTSTETAAWCITLTVEDITPPKVYTPKKTRVAKPAAPTGAAAS